MKTRPELVFEKVYISLNTSKLKRNFLLRYIVVALAHSIMINCFDRYYDWKNFTMFVQNFNENMYAVFRFFLVRSVV